MKNSTTPLSSAQIEALEARFALRLSARLDESAKAVPHDIGERLRVARQQAIRAAALSARPQPVVAPALAPSRQLAGLKLAGASGQASLSGWASSARGQSQDDGPLPWGWRLASALPVLALIVGLWGIQIWYRSEKVQAASDVDMALLTDALPPAAYADPGFEEYLRTDAPASGLAAVATPTAALVVKAADGAVGAEDSGGDAGARP